jgi:2-keto-4-pentenoate hydratase
LAEYTVRLPQGVGVRLQQHCTVADFKGRLRPLISCCANFEEIRHAAISTSTVPWEATMALSEEQARLASDLLVKHWTEGSCLATLPERLRPSTRAEGYAIQAFLERHSARPLYGWKIAATSLDGQRHIGVDGPLAGRLLAERVYENGAKLSLTNNHMRLAEPEFAFRMASDLTPRQTVYEVDEVLSAVESLHTALEMPDSRFEVVASAGAPQLIADNACGHEFVLGPAVFADWRTMDLAALRVSGSVKGKLECEGKGANVLGDPRIALTWLVNELSQLGICLKAGQVVTTGTCLKPMPLAPGDTVRAGFGVLGEVIVSFGER